MSNPVIVARGRLGYAKRTGDSLLIHEASRDLAAEKLAQYIEAVVATAPPLTPTQRDRLTSLLNAQPVVREIRRPKSVDAVIALGGDA